MPFKLVASLRWKNIFIFAYNTFAGNYVKNA
jgi:hypothetical protein